MLFILLTIRTQAQTLGLGLAMSRQEAESVVMEGAVGCYVIRASTSEAGNYVVTVRSTGLTV